MRINLLLVAGGALVAVVALCLAPVAAVLAVAGVGCGAFGLLRDDRKPAK